MNKIKVIEGEIHVDHRGHLNSLNQFTFEDIKRMYFIYQEKVDIIRGWHGHQWERKWFYCVKGSFTLGLVEIDSWEKPSPTLEATIFDMTEKHSKIICVPSGYANCIKAKETNSVMLVLSDKRLEDALPDSWRYDSKLWVNWDQY